MSSLQYDLSPIISSLFNPTDADFNNGVAGAVIRNQIIDVSVYIISIHEKLTIKKVYRFKALRGGEFSTDINIGFNDDIHLSLTDKTPIWEGLPPVYTMTQDLEHVVMISVPPNYINLPVKSCNGLYVMFQNIK